MDPFWQSFHGYVRSYLPHWRYDPTGGEVESAVLLAAAELIERSRSRLALLPQKHELAFLQGWALEPLEPDPMYVCAALTAPEDRPVSAGTEFYLSGDGARLWRTAEDSQASPMRLTDQFLTSGGKILPLPLPVPGGPARLFDLHGSGLSGPEVRFSHPDAFSSQNGCQAELTLPEASAQMLELFSGGPGRWSLLCASGDRIDLPSPAVNEQRLLFHLPPAPDGPALCLSLPSCDLPSGPVGPVTVCTKRTSLPLAMVWDGTGPCIGERWLPFGEVPEVWRTCFLSCPDALVLRGAKLTVSFTLSIREREELLPGMDQGPVYRPIMRRLPALPPPIHEVWADQVLWEYWDGRTWLPLPGTQGDTGCFARPEHSPVRIEVHAVWPKDAAPCQVGGQTGLWLRWRIGRARDSGWLPRCCHAPEVSGLRLSASLEHAPVELSVRGPAQEAFHPLPGPRSPLFETMGPGGDCWWLGFDAPPSGQLLRLYLSLQGRVPGGRLNAWEAAADARERPLTILEDGTGGLSHSGTIVLDGIQGGLALRSGLRRWWLCLQDESGRLVQGRLAPCLEELACGAVRLQAVNGGQCQRGEALSPLRGGPLRGVTLTAGFGGSEREDRSAFLHRARALRHHHGRCVSALDVDQTICAQFRDVLRTRCVREEDTLYVAVLMRDVPCHAAAFARREAQICRSLERDSVLPSLGLAIAAREPIFYPVSAMVWLHPAKDVPPETARRMICDALDRFLDPASGYFQGNGWQIGSLPTEMEARNHLQASSPELTIVKLLLTATAPDGRELDCAQVEDPYSLPLPGIHTVHLLP